VLNKAVNVDGGRGEGKKGNGAASIRNEEGSYINQIDKKDVRATAVRMVLTNRLRDSLTRGLRLTTVMRPVHPPTQVVMTSYK